MIPIQQMFSIKNEETIPAGVPDSPTTERRIQPELSLVCLCKRHVCISTYDSFNGDSLITEVLKEVLYFPPGRSPTVRVLFFPQTGPNGAGRWPFIKL